MKERELQATTIRNYNNCYVKIIDYTTVNFGIDKIIDCSLEQLIECLNTIENSNTRNIHLSVMLIIIGDNNPVYTGLTIYKNDVILPLMRIQIKERMTNITLPSYNELISFLKKQDEEEDSISYIFNYILIYLNVRNSDLDIFIYKPDEKIDKEKNYLLIKDFPEIDYVRTNYKTANAYGTKINTINDEIFYKHVLNQYRIDQQLVPNRRSLGYYIKKFTLNGIGETSYFKIIFSRFKSNIYKLLTMAENRGTDLESCLQYYDTDNTLENNNYLFRDE